MSLIESLFRGMDGDSQLYGSEMSAHMAALHVLASDKSVQFAVECGVGQGWSTIALLTGVAKHNAFLTSIDIKESAKQEALRSFEKVGIAATDHIFSRWGTLVGSSIEIAIRWLALTSVDLLFIDTVHSEEHTTRELEAWLPKMSRNGIICGHDYHFVDPVTKVNYGVKAAVDKFAAKNAHRFRLQVLPQSEGLFILWPIGV